MANRATARQAIPPATNASHEGASKRSTTSCTKRAPLHPRRVTIAAKPAAAKKDGERIRFIGHESIGAKITSEICNRLKLGSTPFYPFHHDDLVWLVREHLFAIKRKGQSIKATAIEQVFFSPRRPGRSLLHCMLADQLASVRATPAAEPEPIETLLEHIRALAPDGTLPPPLISGHDVIEWLDIKEGPRVAELRDAVREEQLHGRLKSKTDAKTFLVSKYGKR